MELVLHDFNAFHLLVGDLSPHGVLAAVQLTGHLKSCGCNGVRNQADDGFIVRQGFSTPIGTYERRTAGAPPCSTCWCRAGNDRHGWQNAAHRPSAGVPAST